MNFAEPFIRRPVATTLLVLTILIFGIMGYRAAAGERPADRRLPDDPGQREPAGREPGDDGRVGRDAAREAVLDDRRHRRRSARRNGQGSTNITLQFDLDRNIDAAAQDVQSMIARDARAAAAGHAVAAVVPEGQPGRLSRSCSSR